MAQATHLRKQLVALTMCAQIQRQAVVELPRRQQLEAVFFKLESLQATVILRVTDCDLPCTSEQERVNGMRELVHTVTV